ncbi:hypothetical protein AAVH_09159 [Aphelenchoides avenae]|nr:hypothetical protein AAVH_09159 [Aphelenchus avenae]
MPVDGSRKQQSSKNETNAQYLEETMHGAELEAPEDPEDDAADNVSDVSVISVGDQDVDESVDDEDVEETD